MLCLAAISMSLATGAIAQGVAASQFKVGDRVEGRFGTKWQICSVEEARSTGGYLLRCDDRPLQVSIFAASDVRERQGVDADRGRQVAGEARKTVEQAINQCSGEPLMSLKTRGRAASSTLFGDVIRSMFDKEARGSTRIHKVVTKIVSLDVGKSYAWRPGTDNQRLGEAKTVYPIKTTFITCDDGMFDWGIAEHHDSNYTCYVDDRQNGEWSCAPYGLGTIKSRQVQKQDGK
jgi:hypothetical protein